MIGKLLALTLWMTLTGCGRSSKSPPKRQPNAVERRLQPAATPTIIRVTKTLARDLDELNRPFVMRWPLDNIDVTSPYGLRMHPVVHRLLFHAGIDFRAPRGEPVLSAGPGHVTQAGWMPLTGNTVIVLHPGRLATLYAHLEETLVFEGQQVDAGAPVGLIGSTGRSTGPHLHFSVYRLSGKERYPVDPTEFIGAVIDPRHPPTIPLPPQPKKKSGPPGSAAPHPYH